MDYLSAIRRESERFHVTADSADPDLGVPSCPGWSIADLVWHLGEVQWFWAAVVEMRATDPAAVEATKPARPAGYPETIAWGRVQAARLLSVLEQNEDATQVWTWSPPHQSVGFIRRHQVQEAAIHRWDIQNAATTAVIDSIDPDIAADCIDEVLAVTLPWNVKPEKPLPGEVHIHCTDTDGEWLVAPDGHVEPTHAKGDAALRGPASDLLLTLYSRIPLDSIEVVGDGALARHFVERIDMN